jgi:GDP-L-fucose synthase
MHEAKINNVDNIEIWGTGKPLREFIYVDDLANACVYLMNNYNSSEIINIGVGKEYSILEIAQIIKKIIGYKGGFLFNTDKPDGMMRRVLDISKLNNLGWKYKIELEDGIKVLYQWYLTNVAEKING